MMLYSSKTWMESTVQGPTDEGIEMPDGYKRTADEESSSSHEAKRANIN